MELLEGIMMIEGYHKRECNVAFSHHQHINGTDGGREKSNVGGENELD
jgi:hypothetical protein